VGTNNRQSKVRMLLIIVIAALLGAGGGRLARSVVQFMQKTHTTPSQLAQPAFGGQRRIYILALGEDNTGSSRSDVYGRSDTIMVLAVDMDRKDVRAISIPRDTRCVIPGRENYDKINSAYALGGPELSRRTAEMLLGVPIQYRVKTNIEGLKRTVDVLGGVEIDIEKDMHYRDRRGGLYINLRKGYRHLDGDKALQYVRFRHDTFGDITRIQRQQKFLRAIARRVFAKENLRKLATVIDEIMRNVETNMSGKDLFCLVELAKQIQPDEVQMDTLPGQAQTIDGISYYVADETKMQAMVDRLLRFVDPVAALPTVEVLNGTGETGQATRVSDLLTRLGYSVVSTGNAPRFGYDQSEIRSRIGDTQKVRQMAALLNSTRITPIQRQDSTEADVTVIVGRDARL